MINTSKPTTSIGNSSKISIGETWGSILTTWASETRTWLAVSQLISNVSKVTQSYLWGLLSFPWLEDSPWNDTYTGMTNISKP